MWDDLNGEYFLTIWSRWIYQSPFPPLISKITAKVRQLTALFYQMGYQFDNVNLPIMALMHRSFDSAEHNYERLEFLGMHCLVIIAEALFYAIPTIMKVG